SPRAREDCPNPAAVAGFQLGSYDPSTIARQEYRLIELARPLPSVGIRIPSTYTLRPIQGRRGFGSSRAWPGFDAYVPARSNTLFAIRLGRIPELIAAHAACTATRRAHTRP